MMNSDLMRAVARDRTEQRLRDAERRRWALRLRRERRERSPEPNAEDTGPDDGGVRRAPDPARAPDAPQALAARQGRPEQPDSRHEQAETADTVTPVPAGHR